MVYSTINVYFVEIIFSVVTLQIKYPESSLPVFKYQSDSLKTKNNPALSSVGL